MAKLLGLDGEPGKEIEIPGVFSTPLRPDIVSRAYWILNSHGLQPYGRDPIAGERTSAETSNPPTGHGISRIPRVKGNRNPRSGMAAGVASVVGGRLPHPPRSEKVIYRKINKKERRLALDTAIAFTADSSAVTWRGHKVGRTKFPLVVSDELEAVGKTSELKSFLEKVGLSDELKRLYGGVKRRSGKPRMRGRSYREPIGPLVVVTNDRGVGKASEAIPGVRAIPVSSLSVLALAPGGVAGRLTLWTESALEQLGSKRKEVAKVEA
jgi:large subunit ribosomal protein L4e